MSTSLEGGPATLAIPDRSEDHAPDESVSHVRPQLPLRVLLVDGHHFFRNGLRALLSEHGLEVVGEASSAAAAVEMAQRRNPQVAVLDLGIAGTSGVELAARLRTSVPHLRLLVLTLSTADSDVVDAIEAGADGYLVKDTDHGEIVRGIKAVAIGRSVLSPAIAGLIIERARRGRRSPAAREQVSALTAREREVLHLLANGKENTAIAEELVITVATVKGHLSTIFRKLEVSNRVQAAIKAVQAGLV